MAHRWRQGGNTSLPHVDTYLAESTGSPTAVPCCGAEARMDGAFVDASARGLPQLQSEASSPRSDRASHCKRSVPFSASAYFGRTGGETSGEIRMAAGGELLGWRGATVGEEHSAQRKTLAAARWRVDAGVVEAGNAVRSEWQPVQVISLRRGCRPPMTVARVLPGDVVLQRLVDIGVDRPAMAGATWP